MKTNTSNYSEYKRMTETPLTKLVLSLSLPSVISTLMTSIYNMADTYFVSSLGDSAIGAVGIVFSIQSIIQAVGFGISMGSSSLISRNLGAKRNDLANKYASSAFYAAMLCGAIIMGICFIDLEFMLNLFGSTDTILPYAKGYATVILLAAPFMCALYVLNASLRAEGKATFSMISMLFGAITNIILDPIFIFELKMGVVGAALATIISQIVNFSISLSFYLRGKNVISLSPKNISRVPRDYWLIVKTGSPTIFRQGLGSVSTALLNIAVKPYGDAAIAAVSIANKIYTILRGILLGVGQGFQVVAGYNFGAKIYSRVKKSFYVAVVLGSFIAVFFSLIVAIIPEEIMNIFDETSAEAVRIGARMLRMLAISLPFLAYSSYVNMLYQSLGFVKGATFLASCRQGIFFIPLILILPHIIKLDGILVVQSAADILTFLVALPFQLHFMRHRLSLPDEILNE